MSLKIKMMPKNEKELVELKAYISACDRNLDKLKLEVNSIKEYLNILEQFRLDFP